MNTKKLLLAISVLFLGITLGGCNQKEDYEAIITNAIKSYNEEVTSPGNHVGKHTKEEYDEIVVRYDKVRKCHYVFFPDGFQGTILKQKKEKSTEYKIVDIDPNAVKTYYSLPEVYVYSK